MTDTGQSPAHAVISFAETHLQPLTEWQRQVIRWAFRGDRQQPLVVEGRYIGNRTPSRRREPSDTERQAAAITLKEPAMDAGQPPDLTFEGARFTKLDTKVEYASFRADDLDPSDRGALTVALNNMAAHGWRLVTFDGERYIFERPQQYASEPRER